MIEIDGARGEGGGQVLRTSLTLAAVLGQPLRVTRIRANRSRPGLMRQHLTAVQAMATVCDGEVGGAALGSDTIEFRPGKLEAGNHHFAVGTAGSANLVLQTVIPALLTVAGESRITVEGGTHNFGAPAFEFLSESYAALLAMAGHDVSIELEAYGFYPAGGGRITATLRPAPRPAAVTLLERGEALEHELEAIISNLSGGIARRELAVAAGLLELPESACHVRTRPSRGPGNVLLGRLRYQHVSSVFAQFGRPNLSAESVANRLA